MKIFLSYASEDRLVAERIYFALVAEGHQVFFDRTGVDAGEEFNRQIPRSAFGYLYFPCPPRLPKCSQSFSKLDLGQPDTLDRNDLSKLIVREDNRDLGPAHSGHKDIGDVGRGRFSHWFEKSNGEYLYFSTSDNSDPRTNGRKYTVTVPGPSAPPVVLDNSMFKKHEPPTFGYRYQGTGLNLSTPDSREQPNVSRLVVLENGKALGPAHSNPNEIRDIGRGKYSHWHDGQAEWLFFSTRDNTDPRENGRTYEVSVEPEP